MRINQEGGSKLWLSMMLKPYSTSSTHFKEIIEETNAKDAVWLVDNIGFIVKV